MGLVWIGSGQNFWKILEQFGFWTNRDRREMGGVG